MPRWPPYRGQDDTATDRLPNVANPASGEPPIKPATGPRTAPIVIRDDTRTPAEKRTGELLTSVILGNASQIKLWDRLNKHWGLAPQAITQRRWHLYQALLTATATADAEWRRATPQRCGPSNRTHLEHCTGRDTCGVHRSHNALWMDAEERFARYLLADLPGKADQDEPPAEPRRTRRRSVQR